MPAPSAVKLRQRTRFMSFYSDARTNAAGVIRTIYLRLENHLSLQPTLLESPISPNSPSLGSGTGPVMLTPEELNQFRAVLITIQSRIKGDVEQLEEDTFSAAEGDHGSSNHIAEMGTDAWEVDFSMRIVENDQEVLSEIAAALNRIEAGVFGLCGMCLETGITARKACISKTRLKTIPYVRNCIDCERRREQESFGK